MKQNNTLVMVFILIALPTIYWGYENYQLINRIDTAFDNGEEVYTEHIKSRHCVGLTIQFFSSKYESEFKIFDEDGALHNEKFYNSIMGACSRFKWHRAEWKKISKNK